MEKAAREWMARLDLFRTEYPFGPIQEFRNEEGRLHREGGPARITPTRCTWYRNGQLHGMDVDIWGSMAFFFRNIRVPRDYIMKPEALRAADVLKHPNTEVRYAGMLLYGYERMEQEGHLRKKHHDDKTGATLYTVSGVLTQPFCVVRVLNSTAEPDGSFKPYYLTVPPDMKTCKEAIAWTFSKSSDEYKPSHET